MSVSKNGSAGGSLLGIAVIGCGGIGQTHARAAREIPGARLVGVSSRDEA
jgi:predicted dehydrogenase